MKTDFIEQFNQGHQAAFTTIYYRYQPAIFSFVQRFIPDTSAAEDIVAESFIKLWQNREKFESEKSINAFLHTTARNASIDWLRVEKRQIQNREQLLFLIKQEQFDEPQTDIKSEVLRLISVEIEKLPRKLKQVFIMAYVDGMTNEEIAKSLGIRNQSVRNHKARALQIIRLAMQDNA